MAPIYGLSILSRTHLLLVTELLRRIRDLGIGEIPVDDEMELLASRVARVYMPIDYKLRTS